MMSIIGLSLCLILSLSKDEAVLRAFRLPLAFAPSFDKLRMRRKLSVAGSSLVGSTL
jgi:hypothetical protein